MKFQDAVSLLLMSLAISANASASANEQLAHDASAPVIIDLGSKMPSRIELAVGQELLFKGHAFKDLLGMRYHDVSMYHSAAGNDSLQQDSIKGYRAAFKAVAPGETKLDLEWNALTYGAAPFGSHPLSVNVVAADEQVAVANKIAPPQN